MLKKRLIACLLWRDGFIAQTVNFKHTNLVGNAITAVDFFNTWAIDEIIILDISPKDGERDEFYHTIKEISERCFVPLTVGGKIKTIEDIRKILKIGADKIVINSMAFLNPDFITEAAEVFGNQCIVVSIDYKKTGNKNQVFINNGKKETDYSPAEWAGIAEQKGAGEIFLTSIDKDGSRSGFDIETIKKVADKVEIPVIASGGVGGWQDFVDGINLGKADAVSAANIFHYSEQSTKKAKIYMKNAGINVREPEFYNIIPARKPQYKI